MINKIKALLQSNSNEESKGFGTFQGVFLPSILTILGVVMYLRMGWMIANVGLFGSIFVITLASSITFLTGLSISATATNMKVKGGGAYFMISRSFGIEAGAAIGLPLFLAQSLGISFYIAGFSESLHSLIPYISPKIIGVIVLIVLTLLSSFSANAAMKIQFLVFFVIILSLFSLFLGHKYVGPIAADTHYYKVSFWKVFAVFLPAVTGIEAGISMSGDLKNPSQSLPIGTIAAIILGYIIYVVIVIFLAYFADNYTLFHNQMIMKDVSLYGSAFYAGIWGATLSSALGALLGAPRTLQALSLDKILPSTLGKGYGKNNEPIFCSITTFSIAAFGILFGNLNLIAPILSMFFLTSYGVLNLISGFEGMIKNPSWRPTFKTPWIVSFIGAIGCFIAMFMINPGASFIAIFCCVIVFFIMRRKNISVRWSDMRRGILLYLSRLSIYNLSEFITDARSWRPNILVLSGSPKSRWYLVEMADAITQGRGFVTILTILSKIENDIARIAELENSVKEFLKKKQTLALVKVKSSENLLSSIKGLLADYGIGPIKPNTLLLGDSENEEKINDFCDVIKATYLSKRNILIVCEDKFYNTRQKNKITAPKLIDIWWTRQSNNAPLMLALAYLLQTSQKWMRSTITLKSIVGNEEEKNGMIKYLQDFLQKSRIDANLKVYLAREEDDPFSMIKTYSSNSDLIFLGMKAPSKAEGGVEYGEYYKKLHNNISGLPMTILTLAGEDISFKEIFT